jgi:UDP-GlcNAc:undecaprenyl-phosphate/decaprenyl-phosphate GlcNAc-1-phosphate transferase
MVLFQTWPVGLTLIALGVGAAVASVLVTRLYIAVARRTRFVARSDPWHDEPVAQSGGVALWVVLLGASFALGLYRDPTTAAVIVSGLVLAGVGLVDDRRPLQPNTKFIAQLAVAVALVMLVPNAAVAHLSLGIAMPIAFVWLVGQSNAVNLLDNMDGMCPAILGVMAAGVTVIQSIGGLTPLGELSAVVSGVSFGFLVWNRKPARVFLGDTGSISLGFVIAFAAMYGAWIGPGSSLQCLPIPALLLAVPLLNIALVVITRYDAGVPVSRGLADHANYRLMAHGFGMRQSVAILCGMAIAGAGVARLYWLSPWAGWMVIVALFALSLTYFAIFLSHADVKGMYSRLNVPLNEAPVALYRMQRRRAFEILTDATLASAACFFGFHLRFDGELSTMQQSNLVRSLPVVVLAAIVAQWVCGSYRVFWKYMGATEAVGIAKASALAAVVLSAATWLPLFEQFPRSIRFLFPMIFFLLATGYRVSLRQMHEWRRSQAERGGSNAGLRVLIVGAGDAGELALRDLRNGQGGPWSARGFLDDDPQKIGLRIHGVTVLAPTSAVAELASEFGIQQVVLAMPSAPLEKRRSIIRVCEERGITVRVFHVGSVPPIADVTTATQAASLPR